MKDNDIMKRSRFSSRSMCAVLLICILYFIFYYSRNHATSTDSIPNVNYSVEVALAEIPVCDINDRSRQHTLLTTLHAWSQFAHQHHIQYWIAYGSLVGYIQRRGLLPHDLDVDILMLAQDTRHLLPFVDINFSPIYELKIHPQWNVVGYASRSYLPLQDINFIAPNGRFIHRELRNYVEIWPIYDFHPDQPKDATSLNKTLTEYNRSFNWTTSPRHWTFPLQKCSFSGIQVWCPAMPERLISMIYGIDALNKSDKMCINNTWITL